MADYLALNYCPQCGAALADQAAYGRVRRYCPACKRVVFRDPKAAAGVVVERDGQALLVRRSTKPRRGLWSIPAGFIEYDEAPAAAAVRECAEETGLRVKLTALLDVIPGEGLPGEASFLIVYLGRITGGQLQAQDDAEQAAFFDPDDLPPLAFSATHRALERWRARSR
ncbi:MAG: NUDIX hydrolase [Anaerolineae bacterium]|nr:NUDIX hydrolase [Anaerolineae bacterium]